MPRVEPRVDSFEHLELEEYGENPWDRRPGETHYSYAQFLEYRDLGPLERSWGKIAKKHNKAITTYSDWARVWRWKERAYAWDVYLESVAREAAIAAAREMGSRHARIAMTMLDKVEKRLGTFDPEKLGSQTLAQWAATASQLERLTRGAPTERVEQSGDTRVTVDDPFAATIASRIQNDPKARELMLQVLSQVASENAEALEGEVTELPLIDGPDSEDGGENDD